MSSHGTPLSYVTDAHEMALHLECAAELGRTVQQDMLLAQVLGEQIPPALDPTKIHIVLDIACGPGGWLLDLAFKRPKTLFFGIDLSEKAILYARSQARVQGLSGNTRFTVMDATKSLAFPNASFDLVNARFASEFMPRKCWSAFLYECARLLRPGGTLLLTEHEVGSSTSFSQMLMGDFRTRATMLAGLSFTSQEQLNGLSQVLSNMMLDAGFEKLVRESYLVDYSYTSPLHGAWFRNLMEFWEIHKPFVLKSGVTSSEEYDQAYSRMLYEMGLQDFVAESKIVTVWGQRPL